MECNQTIFEQLHNSCYLQAPLKMGVTRDEANCAWTCADVEYYCARQAWYDHIITVGMAVTHPLQYQLYHVGCICNLLLFLTLLSRTLTGTTFMFLRLMSFVQLCLGLLYYFHPGADPDFQHNWSYNIVWPEIMKEMIVAGRFMLNILTVFLTLDRFLAVYCNSLYSKINQRAYFLGSVLISFVISLIEMEAVFRYQWTPKFGALDPNGNGRFYNVRNEYGNYVYTHYIVYTVIGIKAVLLACMTFFGVAIIFKLFSRGRQVAKMLGTDSAVNEYKEMLGLCRFQLVDMLVMIVDIIVTVLMDLQLVVEVPGDYRGTYCSMNENLYSVNMYLTGWILDVTKDQFLALEHGELFFIYLICFKKFRWAFVDVCSVAVRKVRKVVVSVSGGDQKSSKIATGGTFVKVGEASISRSVSVGQHKVSSMHV